MTSSRFELSNSSISIDHSEIILNDNWGTHTIKNPIGFRFGTDPIDFYEFRIGYNYKIQILGEKNKLFSIPLKSYFGIKRNGQYSLQNEIINCLWENHFHSFYLNLIEQYKNEDLEFDNYKLTESGLLITQRNELILFNDMKIDKRFQYFTVNSISNSRLYTNVYYLKTWNSSILQMILEGILESINTSK